MLLAVGSSLRKTDSKARLNLIWGSHQTQID